MIRINKDVLDQVVDHARQELPFEACGYLAGNNDDITSVYRLRNADQSPEHFSFDPEEQFGVLKDVRKKGLQIIANYHSHPSTPARPSDEDIRLAYDPEIRYVIISLSQPEPAVKVFRISNGLADNEELQITD